MQRVILLVVLIAGAVAGTCSDSPSAVEVWGTAESDGEGNRVGCINFSEDLHGISSGNPLAVRLTLEVGEGWRMVDMTELETGNDRFGGMKVTVSISENGRRAEILVDGCPASEEIKCIPVVGLVEVSPVPCRLTVSGGQQGDGAVYYLNRDGEIQRLPVCFTDSHDPSETESEESGETQKTPAHDAGDEKAETTDEQKVTVTEQPPFVFLGCRETSAREEGFAVQFLFCGDERYTPVVCFSGGGGVLLLVDEGNRETLGEGNEDRIPVGKALYTCTFWGLPSRGEIIFLVGTPEGIRKVTYRDGKFCGFSQ